MKSLARSAVLLYCSAIIIPSAVALDNKDATLSLQVADNSVSADIREAPLAEIARALEMKTGVTFHFQAPQVKDQEITVRFKNVALEAALRAILEKTSYAMATKPTKQGVDIQVYVYSEISKSASTHGRLAASEIDVAGQAPDPTPQHAEAQPEDPIELPRPSDVFDPDPAVRARELEEIVAIHGPQSLAVVLAAAQDPDAQMRTVSVDLLLNDLRDVIPREDLATIAYRSEHPDIRLQALEALAEREDWLDHAHMTLDSALHDTDPQVQQRAEELLLELSKSESDATR